MDFRKFLLESKTVTQFLKEPNNQAYIKEVKNNVMSWFQNLQGNQNNISRVVNWFIKELIVRQIPVSQVNATMDNMWNNIGDYLTTHINDNTVVSKLNTFDFNYQSLIELSEKWHEKLKDKRYKKAGEGRTIIDLNDLPGFAGWKWVAMDSVSCSKEADSMGHCGNAGGKEDDNILSLRDPENYAHLTFINNKGVLGEMKGRGNSKPTQKYHPAIIKLLLSNEIASIKGGGYASNNNFSLDDLTPKEQEYIRKHKPWIDKPYEFTQKRQTMLDGLKKKDRSLTLQKSDISNVGNVVKNLINAKYVNPQIWDEKPESETPQIISEKQAWKFFNELLNETYIKAKKMKASDLFSWMDKAIEAFIDEMMIKDRQIFDRHKENRGFFPNLSNLIKLDEMVYGLMQKQPEILMNAPRRYHYDNFNDYLHALQEYLENNGYDLPSYRPDNNMVSYEFNVKMAKEIAKHAKELKKMLALADEHRREIWKNGVGVAWNARNKPNS